MGDIKLRIGIDGRCLSGNLTGIGRYVYELITELDTLLENVTYFVYSPLELSVELPSDRWVARVDKQRYLGHNILTGYAWLKLRCAKLAKNDNLDIFWANRTLLPELHTTIKTVSTVHDLNHLLVPETMPIVNYLAHKLWFRRDVIRADSVITNSKGTSDRLLAHLGRKTEAVIYPSISAEFYHRGDVEVERIRNQYDLDTPYLLGVGTQEPRKNLVTLVNAFTGLKQQGELTDYKLALVGPGGWKNSGLRQSIEKSISGSVVSLGYVPDQDLPILYSGATAFVFPSLYEGFGMPVLEARACGTAVVTTDIPELREAGGTKAVYIDPSIDGIQEGILQAVTSMSCSNGAREGIDSWRHGAVTLAATFRKVAAYSL